MRKLYAQPTIKGISGERGVPWIWLRRTTADINCTNNEFNTTDDDECTNGNPRSFPVLPNPLDRKRVRGAIKYALLVDEEDDKTVNAINEISTNMATSGIMSTIPGSAFHVARLAKKLGAKSTGLRVRV